MIDTSSCIVLLFFRRAYETSLSL